MSRQRDSQRSKVHQAINQTAADLNIPMSLDRLHAMLDKVRNRVPIKRRYGSVGFFISDGRGYGATNVDMSKRIIHAPHCQRDPIHVLGAFAHIVLRDCNGERKNQDDLAKTLTMPWHGWGYCSVLLDLVYFGLGENEANVLKNYFEKFGVRFRKPIVRMVTSDQKLTNQLRGQSLAAKMKRRRLIQDFLVDQPYADLLDLDTFENDEWETLFRLWCP